jgi:hypothetical protein
MSNLNQVFSPPTWPSVYQIETGDPVLGGSNGVANLQAKALLERTEFLRAWRGVVNGLCELDASGMIPVNRLPAGGKAVTLKLVGTQTMSTSVFTTVTLTPSITDNELFSWAAGVFTVKKTGTYRISSRLHFAVYQTSNPACSAVLQLIYSLGAGNTTVFSEAPATYSNGITAYGYNSPGTSSAGNNVHNIEVDGTTAMTAGDKFNLQFFTDSNAGIYRNIDNSSIGKQMIVVQFLG